MSLVKLLPAWLHAVADYAVGISLIVVALLVGGATKSVLPGVVVGAVVLLVSLLTRYPLGLIKVLPFQVHSAGDYLAAALLIASPFALGFFHTATPLSVVYLVAGVAVLGVSLITNYQYGPVRTKIAAEPGWAPASAPSPAPAPSSAPYETTGQFDARRWYDSAIAVREAPAPAPAAEPAAAAAPLRRYGVTAAAADAPVANGRVLSLREAIAADRQREAS